MKNKGTIFILLVLFIQMVSCCKKSFDNFYYSASDIRIKNVYHFNEISNGETISQDGFRIKLYLRQPIVELIENINETSVSLGYCEDTSVSIKKKITSLRVSCNNDIWNTLANNPLIDSNFSFYQNKFEEDLSNPRFTLQEWIELINNEDQLVKFEWFLELNEPIYSIEFLNFKLTFLIENGTEYILETPLVKFE